MIRTARMLLGYLLAPSGPHPAVRESEREGYDLYELLAGTTRRTVLLVHGVSFKGCKDPREIAFARRLARAGLRVAAIDLAGLKRCEFEESDVAAIAALADRLRAEFGDPVTLVGFSFGGGLALAAACRSPAVDRVLGFGACHSLETVWEHVLAWCAEEPPDGDADAWDDFIYLLLVMAYAARDRLELDADGVFQALYGYCAESSLARKREAYARIREMPVLEAFKAGLSPEALRAVSPAGKLAKIGARVGLLHDAGDRIVPPAEAERLIEELTVEGKAARALVTPLLSHVDAGSPRGLGDVPGLLSLVAGALR